MLSLKLLNKIQSNAYFRGENRDARMFSVHFSHSDKERSFIHFQGSRGVHFFRRKMLTLLFKTSKLVIRKLHPQSSGIKLLILRAVGGATPKFIKLFANDWTITRGCSILKRLHSQQTNHAFSLFYQIQTFVCSKKYTEKNRWGSISINFTVF